MRKVNLDQTDTMEFHLDVEYFQLQSIQSACSPKFQRQKFEGEIIDVYRRRGDCSTDQ